VAGEPADQAFAMLEYAPREIARHADVERPIPLARQDIDVEGLPILKL